MNCQCLEIQPRRGKNLPEGGLDSRAKRLIPHDKDDYEFTVNWLNEFAHPIYRNKSNHIIGLSDMTEVSLCKAHSSTLYRAKKKHLRQQQQQESPPSPVDSQSNLASKVQGYQPPQAPPQEFMMTTSTSTKRKRTNTSIPSSSASTPLFNHSQLPPLHLRTPSLTSLSSNLQHQLTFNTRPIIAPPPPYQKVIETVSLKSSTSANQDDYYIQNLAITDSYTFKDLLSEIDFAGSPPPGKRIVISDDKRERIFPLSQPIRSVIRYPSNTHIEFYLGLSDKPSIDWNNYK